MKCPDCGSMALNAAAGYACSVCGTLNADGHTLWTFLDTLTGKEQDLFWNLACQYDTMPFVSGMPLLGIIVGRFGVNPYEAGTCQWNAFEREWLEQFPDKVRHQ
jgi:hypothetical protein